MELTCLHCGGLLVSERRWFCSTRCRMRAYRRRRAGVPQTVDPGTAGARRGRASLRELRESEIELTLGRPLPRA